MEAEIKPGVGPPTTWLSIENIAKVAAVLGAASLIIGVTYNVAFFAGTQWLFNVSIADNITATMYALPYALAFFILYFAYAWGARRATFRRNALIVVPVGMVLACILLLLSKIFIGDPGEWFGTETLPSHLFLAAVFATAIGMGGALSGTNLKSLLQVSEHKIRSAVVVSLSMLISLLLGPIFLARDSRIAIKDRPMTVDVDIAQKGAISGSVVRILDGGILVEQGQRWVWIPRSEIKLIVERKSVRPRAKSDQGPGE
jgi:hypothetical protein